MHSPDYSISTPENVDLHLELAGIGNRILAILIDTIITWLVIAIISVIAALIALMLERAGQRTHQEL